jgi:protein-S-isoprenylcysteine O-methyltransferase Ste14
VYGEYGRSSRPKAALTALHSGGVLAAWWLLFGGGFETVGRWTGAALPVGDALRRLVIFACAVVYFARVCFTLFYLTRRRFGWGEAFGIGLYVIFVDVFFALLGGTNPRPLGAAANIGGLLYLLGSYLNTGSEYLRHVWKKKPENQGRLYTQGLFRYAMHINYFGDEVLFTGYALITGSPWALIVPALMAAGFLFINVPMLDTYLKKRYGADFDDYSRRTKKFIPFLY